MNTACAYYNEIDPFAAAWLGNLWPDSTVDQRSIEDVQPIDLDGIRRCHFFAGIGGWEYALALAGWPADRPVWTGSCPCQPFSSAGKQEGAADERHLWPAWYRLICECRPAIVFGEQVPRAIAHGWLDAVFTDLEAEGYACGAVVLGACGVGAPHIRQRLYWVADAQGSGGWSNAGAIRGGAPSGIREPQGQDVGRAVQLARDVGHCGATGGLADARRIGIRGAGLGSAGSAPVGVQGTDGQRERLRADVGAGGASLDPWRDAEWIYCRDGKYRPTKPGIHPLAHGVPGRVGRLRAYGNAIVPQVAAAFVTAYMERAS